jgi:histidinol-phosphate/aromatic aminotransferase/cobyric acid decarboxylase-like protein
VTNEPAEDIDPARLDAALRREKIALAFLCTPNNPTGRVLPPDDIAALSAAFPETLFLVDEALIDPAGEGAMALTKMRRNVIVLRTFSKYFGLAGFRVGYAVGDPDLMRDAEVGRPPFNVAAPSVEAAVAALDDAAFLARCKAIFSEGLAFFTAEVATSAHMSIRGSHANMVLLELSRRGAAEAADALAARGMIVADASSFRGLEQRDMLRISLRDRAANRKLLDALKAIA